MKKKQTMCLKLQIYRSLRMYTIRHFPTQPILLHPLVDILLTTQGELINLHYLDQTLTLM